MPGLMFFAALSACCSDGAIKFADMEPAAEVLKAFKPRGDNQIMSLEILSIALGEALMSVRRPH